MSDLSPRELLDLAYPRHPERKSASHGEAGYERAERDFYPTEPWVTRALLAAVDLRMPENLPYDDLVWEPACGDGRMASVLKAAGYNVMASDIHDYGWPHTKLIDFLRDDEWSGVPVAAIVTNPPFDQATPFILRALALVKAQCGKVAMVQRHEFDAPRSRHPLFAWPFAQKLVLHKRPKWVEQQSPGNETGARFPFAWYVWDFAHQGPPILRYLPDPDKPAKAVGELL